MPLRLAILTISDAGSRGERSDTSGDLIASWAKSAVTPSPSAHSALEAAKLR